MLAYGKYNIHTMTWYELLWLNKLYDLIAVHALEQMIYDA